MADPVQVLGAFDLVLLGIGGIIGAGVFVLTGVAAHDKAGPAVVVSYLLASGASFLAALCYTEFAVELPVAGSAYNYVAVTFGELPAFLVGCDLVLEYSISAAAVARGWTSYAATLCGFGAEAFRLDVGGGVRLDLLAFGNVALQAGILCLGIKESSNFNIFINVINLLCIAFVLAAGAGEVEPSNYRPFAPFGVSGVFGGAAIVFFSFIGFDTGMNIFTLISLVTDATLLSGHRRGGGAEPWAGPAAGHHRQPGHLHLPLHRHVRGHHRDGALHRD